MTFFEVQSLAAPLRYLDVLKRSNPWLLLPVIVCFPAIPWRFEEVQSLSASSSHWLLLCGTLTFWRGPIFDCFFQSLTASLRYCIDVLQRSNQWLLFSGTITVLRFCHCLCYRVGNWLFSAVQWPFWGLVIVSGTVTFLRFSSWLFPCSTMTCWRAPLIECFSAGVLEVQSLNDFFYYTFLKPKQANSILRFFPKQANSILRYFLKQAKSWGRDFWEEAEY